LTELETFPAFAVDIENKPKAAATRIAFALFIDIDIDVLMLMQIMMNSIRLGLGWIRRMKKSRCSAFCVLLRAPPFASFDKVGGPAGRSIPPTNNAAAIFHCVVWKAAMTQSSLGHSYKSFEIYL
jgi:hypothetical protein